MFVAMQDIKKKILLLAPIKSDTSIDDMSVEFFGPWAQPSIGPDDLQPPQFVPYGSADDVLKANHLSWKTCDELFQIIYSVMPEITGLRNMHNRFWYVCYGFFVLFLSGICEDIKTRVSLIKQEDYTLGYMDISSLWDVPHSWRDTMQLLVHNDSFRLFIMQSFAQLKLNQKTNVQYRLEDERYSIPAKKQGVVRKVAHHLKTSANNLVGSYRVNMLGEKNRSCGIPIMWDHANDFEKYLRSRYLRFENIVGGQREYDKVLSRFEYDKKKRDQIREVFPYPYGDILASVIPISSLEALPATLETIDLHFNNSCCKERKIYSKDWNFLSGVRSDFNRIAAALVGNDTKNKIIAIQPEGLNYYSQPLLYFIGKVYDDYITCGLDRWGKLLDQEEPSFMPRPVPSIKLHRLAKHIHQSKNVKKWDAIFVVIAEDKGVKWLYPPIFPELAYDYFKRQKKMFSLFDANKKVMVKMYPREYGWHHDAWIKRLFPHFHCERRKKDFERYILTAKLIIVDYNSTAFREVLAAGIPFIATWDRRWWKGEPLFEKALDMLAQAGIFYDDVDECVRMYRSEIDKDVAEWWNKSWRQELLKRANEYFMYKSGDAVKEWDNELSC